MYRKLNICVTALLSVVFVVLAVMTFGSSYLRFFETCGDFWQSVKYFFCEILSISHKITPTVTEYSKVIQWEILLPEDFALFKEKATEYITLLFSKDNFLSWSVDTAFTLGGIAKAAAIVLPCLLVLWMLIKKMYLRNNTDHNKDTMPLRVFKKLTVTYIPVKNYIKQYLLYVKEHKAIYVIWAVLWAFSLNLASVIMGFLAYYFYFAVSYDFTNLYMQFCKLVIDLQVVLKTIPLPLLLLVAWLLFERFRKGIALSWLNRLEMRNRSYIQDLPLVSMTCGSMGKKKTTVITDMALSQEVFFRNIAFAKLKTTDMKFPNFPWIGFEMQLRKCMEHGTVYNLATTKEWVKLKRTRFEKHGNSALQLYGYDYARYGLYYDDKLKVSHLFDVLETYAQLYFIYVIQSSLIVSNYSIRTDNTLLDEGNFPLWVSNFFPDDYPDSSRHTHILDFDVLRLGRKVIESNPNNGSFEFGVVVISEVGKERGNNLELTEMKKKSNETNQKNDLFNSWLKMCRHSATVDNFPFIKVFTDEQRPESWGADARDLCDIVTIVSSSEQKLTLPFYTLEEMVSEWFFDRFINLYYDVRFRRGDNTLFIHLLKGITAWLYRRNARIYNRYGYSVVKTEKERGTMDGQIVKKNYNIMNRKIYSDRFSTDCFSDYFNDMAKKTKVGLNDYLEYAATKASIGELKMQNSYFIDALYKDADSD